jgi:phage gp29-like protein
MGTKISINDLKKLVREEVQKQMTNEKTINEEKKKPSAGLTKKKKSAVVKAAKSGKDFGKKGKEFKEVEKKAKESGAKDPAAVAGAVFWKGIKR